MSMSTSTTYASFQITNNTATNGSGLTSDQIYLFVTQEAINLAWSIDPSSGIATPLSSNGTLPSTSFTLADLVKAGGAIQIDSSADVSSARIYFGSSTDTVTIAGGKVSGPTPGTAQFYYDFVEFALNGPTPNNLNVDTTQVDQLGFPITLQVSPADPNFPAGSGIISTLDRQTLIGYFQNMATGPLAPFADCVIANPASGEPPFRLLNPQHVLSALPSATTLEGTIATSGSAGNWQATFTINGPGSPPPTNGALSVGMTVSGPLIPAGTTIQSVPFGQTVAMTSNATVNPFTASSSTLTLYFFEPITSALGTYFDQAIDDFFTYYQSWPGLLKIEQNSGGTDYVYNGSVVEVSGITAIDGTSQTYTVLQFTGGNNETYNVYYPFFSTNSPAGKTTPFGAAVPPPPQWWGPDSGMTCYDPPSVMVFGASGVFADSVQQSAITGVNGPLLGAIENVIVTGLSRGCATNWQFKYGTVVVPNSAYPTSAVVTLEPPETSPELVLIEGCYMFSLQLADAPMTVALVPPPVVPGSPPTFAPFFNVSSPVPMQPTTQDLLTFAQFYPNGGTWSAFANFLHNGAGQTITINGRAYALPFDDQGGFSSDLSSTWTAGGTPSTATIILGPWQPSS